MSASEILVA